MVVFYNHVEFIPGNIYISESESTTSVEAVGLTPADCKDRYGQYIPENPTKYAEDFLTAIRNSRSGNTAIYLGTIYNDAETESYHVIYVLLYGNWVFKLVPMQNLYHVIPWVLYNNQNVANLKNDLATIFKHSYQTSNDRFRQGVRSFAIEYTSGFVTILGYYFDNDWQPILSYNKKEKTLEALGDVTSDYFAKDDIAFLNAVILSLFSSQRYMFMSVEDEKTFELIKL